MQLYDTEVLEILTNVVHVFKKITNDLVLTPPFLKNLCIFYEYNRIANKINSSIHSILFFFISCNIIRTLFYNGT